MKVTAQHNWPQGLTMPAMGSQHRLFSPAFRGTDQRDAHPGFPAGPGLSAVDMAAACLCLGDAVWTPVAQRPVRVETRARG